MKVKRHGRSLTFGERTRKRLEKMIVVEEMPGGVFRVQLHTAGMTYEMAKYIESVPHNQSNAKGAAESARLYFIAQITDRLKAK